MGVCTPGTARLTLVHSLRSAAEHLRRRSSVFPNGRLVVRSGVILGRVTGAEQARQEQLAATLGRRPGTGPERHCNGSRLPDQGWEVISTDVTGGLRGPSVTPEPAWRLDALQFGKIKPANRLQLVCERGLLKIVGQMVEPRWVAILEVEQGAHRILPALRSGPAVLRAAVLHPGLLCLAA